MLKLSDVKKSNGKNVILTNVNYTFNKGQLYPILGGLSAGKTTLFECICGDLPIDEGTIETRAKSTIFFATKQSVLPMLITGYEFINMLCDINTNCSEPDYYFEKVGIPEETRNKHIGEYSFEEKKRLQLAAFLVQKPYIILFDEPLDYCSEGFINDFISVLRDMQDTHIILISTSLLEIAEKISPDIVILNNGELNLIDYETMQVPEIRAAVLDILGEADNEID